MRRGGGGGRGRGWSLGAPGFDIAATLGLLVAAQNGLEGQAEELQATWTEILNSPGTGKQYEEGIAFITHRQRVFPVPGRPGHPGRASAHRASAPGEPPASDDSLLEKAVQIQRKSPFKISVGMGGEIGRVGLVLEFGLNVPGSRVGAHPAKPSGYKIEPRPHARPAGKIALGRMRPGMHKALRSGTRATL
jgi:hypothetical protein